ncbi:unnamed protein product [Cochlearia groenlandica]
MDVFDKWVAEFLIRRQDNPRVSVSNLLSALKFEDSDDFLKLKVSSVLRDISDSLVRGRIDETTLDLLEILDKLMLKQQQQQHSESHKSAYCWTAVECTVRFMWPLSASDGLFSDAVERIWKKRIGVLKESGSDLVTHVDLFKWETDLNKALDDPEVYLRIRESNVRYTAINFLNQLLQEQWKLLGSSSLDSVAIRSFRSVVDNVREANAVVDESARPLESEEKEEENVNGREEANDVEGVRCVEKDDAVGKSDAPEEEEETMGGEQEDQEHQPSFDEGDKAAARELKDYLLEIKGKLEPSSAIQGQEPPSNEIDHHSVDVTPQPARVHRAETPQGQDDTDSGGTWSGRVRPRLSTPSQLNVSPLNKRSCNIRRVKKFWSLEQVEALREGVKEYGKSWKDIKNANPDVFRERTEVDLKDKWRNLVR